MKVLITEKLADPGVELLREEAEVDVHLGLSPEELLERIGDYDGLIIRSAMSSWMMRLTAGVQAVCGGFFA